MKKIKYDLRRWLSAYGELLGDEQKSLNFYRTSYGDEIPKEELETNLVSLEAWAAYAHKNRLLFHVTAFIASNDQPYADILFNDGNVLVHFIDEHNRIYMAYEFDGKYDKDKVFLDSLRCYFYPDNEKFYGRRDSIKDVQYIFTPKGKLTVWDRYLENGKWFEEAKEAAHPVNVEKNWEPYPELGNYDSIVRMKRWGDGDLLKDIPELSK